MDTGLNFEHAASVKCCCCFGRGEAKLEANFEKNVFIIGEQARALYRLDTTNFKDNIDSVTLMVIRQVTMRNNSGRAHSRESGLISRKEAGISSGTKDEQGKLIELQIGQPDFTFESIQNMPFQPSMESELLDISYSLRLVASPSTCCLCCSEVPVSDTKVRIIPPAEVPPMMMMVMPAPMYAPVAAPGGEEGEEEEEEDEV